MDTSYARNASALRSCSLSAAGRAVLVTLTVVSGALGGFRASAQDKEHPLVPALEFARASREAAAKLEDFEATFFKQDIVRGRVYPHTMQIKFRTKPFSVYLKFHEPHAGREVIFVDGKHDGKLLAHETGIKSVVGTVALTPTSAEAMSESLHPITRIGLENLVIGIVDQWEAESKYGECDVKYFHNAKLGKTECRVVQCSHPVPRKEFKCHMTRLYIDKETNLPICVEHFGFPPRPGAEPPLLEKYVYTNIRANVGLKDVDFDVQNPAYGF